MFRRRISLNSMLLLLLANFVSRFRLELMYISLILNLKGQVKPHSSPWFSVACGAALFIETIFFHLYQHNKSSESKVKFRQVRNHCKRVLEAAKLAYATKKNESITSQKLGSWDF